MIVQQSFILLRIQFYLILIIQLKIFNAPKLFQVN